MEDLDRQSFLSLLLSHHPVENWHLCFRFRLAGRDLAVCPRCLGIFTAGALTMLVGHLTGRWPEWVEWTVLMFTPLPALVEYATAAVAGKPPRRNWIRLANGLGAGVSIGGALHVNSYALLSKVIVAQFLYIIATVLLVQIIVYIRFGLKKRKQVKQRLRERPSFEEYIRRSFDDKG